jgi:hypothetical protein
MIHRRHASRASIPGHRRYRPPRTRAARLLLACFATRRLDLDLNTALHGRAIATTRFRCRRCGTQGVPKIRPGTATGRRSGNARFPVVLMHLGGRPSPARQAAMVGKPPVLSLPWLRWSRRVAHTRASVSSIRQQQREWSAHAIGEMTRHSKNTPPPENL